jgi:hypothetical protein
MAAPNPRLAPVMTMTLSFSFMENMGNARSENSYRGFPHMEIEIVEFG